MKDSTRARVAAAVAAAAKGKKVSSVYDYSAGQHRNASAELRNGNVKGYDYSTSSHFSGGSRDLNFYDYETSAHVQLKLDGEKFKGYDYHTGAHFSGTVRGRSISLYDYETGQHYNFSA
jgi:hypothetical protein